ncbi:MAG: efflux RND transporter periplasmic adaptor subunit [bacterium]|nr:efflux RND transporter periplasmic adaptor subunit [bacterium]
MQYHRLAVAALATTLALTACGKGGAPRGPAPLSVDVATAAQRDIATYLSLDGQIAPLEQSTLAFQQSGPISAIYVNVGDRVSAGQVLAKIDDSTLRAQLAQAQAQAAQQSASAQGATVGLPVAQQQNQAALATAKAALDNAKLVYDQDQQLFTQGYVSQSQLAAARASYVQAQNQYENAQIGLRNNVVSEQNVKAAQAAAQAAAANANTLRTEIGQTVLYAPYDGVITARNMDPGAFAGPQSPVLAISRVSTVWININVPDEDLAYVQPGAKVTFASSSLPGKNFTGRIATVNAVPTQGTLSYLARLQMPNAGDLLRGGMLVTATLVKQSHANAVVVPRTAIAQTENGDAVYVVGPDDKAQEVPVRVGIQTDTLSEVISPKIRPGTKVITTRPDALKDGSVVAVNGATPQPSASPGGAH